MHLLMGLIYAYQPNDTWRDHLETGEVLLGQAMTHVIQRLSRSNLNDKAALLPMSLVSMFSLSLFRDMTDKYPNISDTYSEYLKALVSDAQPTLLRAGLSS